MIWSNRSYYASKGKIILWKGLDGMPIKLYAPKETTIDRGINTEYTISRAKGNTYYIKVIFNCSWYYFNVKKVGQCNNTFSNLVFLWF